MTGDRLLEIVSTRQCCADGDARAIREHAGLSLAEVADELGVAIATVHRWETGERRPRPALAIAYGRLLDRLAGDQ